MRDDEKRVRNQTHNHYNNPIYRQRKTQLPEEVPPEALRPPQQNAAMTQYRAPAKQALIFIPSGLCFFHISVKVVLLFKQLLVQWRVGARDLVVEQAGQDEADARAAGAADVGEDGFEARDGHRD